VNPFLSSLKNAWRSIATKLDLPTRGEIIHAISVLPLGRKLIVYVLLVVFLLSAVGVIWSVNDTFMVKVASPGGSFTEGIIGTPRFINPILAISDADRDLSTLVYSGLMRPAGDNTLIPDLAASYTVSDDGLQYNFILKSNLTWHDGEPITADDVIYTIEKAQDSQIKSPKRASWEGVKAEKLSDTEIQFTLKQPYASFLENTTLGILPKHLWSEFSAESFSLSELNTEPIGSGPYKIVDVQADDRGIPTSYELRSFRRFTLGQPPIKKIVLRFYSNERDLAEAYRKHNIEAMGSISPSLAAELDGKKGQIIRTPLPRIFGVFFNQNQSEVLAMREVRQALSLATPREAVVREVLKGYGTPINTALLPETPEEQMENFDKAVEVLEAAGWQKNEDGILVKKSKSKTLELRFDIVTSDTPELTAAANIIKDS
jgi:peptide/nickel transport system substrate-binding protein